MHGDIPPLPIRLHGMVLNKHQGKFYLIIIIIVVYDYFYLPTNIFIDLLNSFVNTGTWWTRQVFVQ
jgi:hypothetical protein